MQVCSGIFPWRRRPGHLGGTVHFPMDFIGDTGLYPLQGRGKASALGNPNQAKLLMVQLGLTPSHLGGEDNEQAPGVGRICIRRGAARGI